ncbi:hypothetical protein HaLaN_05163 [Haematococcus lacustris]|uniref:Uncharacterized protein n=1 Tax=Haematococcus lacustris TaxID=44745 RepID=A0A699Z3F1_HAELA|nr:hypothetical protein HaLaN_05163 [Haematococcus lacustris]
MDQLFVSVDVGSTTHAPRKGAPAEMAKSGFEAEPHLFPICLYAGYNL